MKGWSNLGAVDTIYEDEEDEDYDDIEEDSANSLSFSSPSESTTPLHSIVEAWTLATGLEPNANIRVHSTFFRLHKVPLTSSSSYLKRQLTASSDLVLSPPLNITAETFRLVAEFCYGAQITITPSNVTALLTAAELLQLTDGDGSNGLRLIADANFHRFLTARSGEHVAVLFRTSLDLLPESETTAACVSRCAEVVSQMEEDEIEAYLEDVVAVGVGEFQIMVESMQIRLSNHDLLYRILDIYLQEHGGKIGDEDKSQISSCVDCTKLSPDLLIHAVQNPRMPLRFAIRAMLVEQLRTRHTVLRATNSGGLRRSFNQPPPPAAKIVSVVPADETTLGGILHRDAALKQAVQLKAAMTATRSRIQSLEAELSGMKQQLLLSDSGDREAVETMSKGGGSIMEESGKRSKSFHYGSSMESSKIERGGRRSASSLSCRFSNEYREEATTTRLKMETPSPRKVLVVKKSLGQRFISGLKLAFSKVSKVDSAAAGITNNK